MKINENQRKRISSLSSKEEIMRFLIEEGISTLSNLEKNYSLLKKEGIIKKGLSKNSILDLFIIFIKDHKNDPKKLGDKNSLFGFIKKNYPKNIDEGKFDYYHKNFYRRFILLKEELEK